MQNLTLYSSLLSANGRKVQSVCGFLGITPKLVETNVYKGEGQSNTFMSINPLGKIPVLVDASLTLNESNAIIRYLSEQYSNDRTTLHGSTPVQEAEILQWLFWESSQWQPVLIDVMSQIVGHQLIPSVVPPPTTPANWNHNECTRQLDYLNDKLKGTEYLVDDQLSLADISVAAMTTYFKVADFPFKSYPNIANWYQNLSSLDAWKCTENAIWS